ncbi:hypothetical protein G6011_09553 [Alternaria panax]|uniref:Uncharacterized protein n=1 Tax=Alternaria panax TaxID=48097 RepID=A0AAD4FAP7_9PLEO|nr:hypothetical protein G6011_09553 [Alternaria panax]
MSHLQSYQASAQPSEGSIEPHHQTCCVQAAVYVNNLYHHNQAQLRNVNLQLQATQNEVEDARRQIVATEQALQREREESELLNQQFIELQECHCKLLKEHENSEGLHGDLHQSATDSQMFADEVAKRAESLVNNLRAKLDGAEACELQNGQSISGMILESAKNALLVQTILSQDPEEALTKLKYVMDQNVNLQ